MDIIKGYAVVTREHWILLKVMQLWNISLYSRSQLAMVAISLVPRLLTAEPD